MAVGVGEYRIEYYGADGRLITRDEAKSLGEAKAKAEAKSLGEAKAKAEAALANHRGLATSYMVLRCVVDSLDGG
jgi:hypothetical protein